MAINDTYRLRKDQRYTEALSHAESDYARIPATDEARALFWCLNDQLKEIDDSKVSEIVERMKCLFQQHPGISDSYTQSALGRAMARLNPVSMEIRRLRELAKSGNAFDSYCKISNYYENGELPVSSYQDYGWIIYHALHQDESNDVVRRRKMLNRYLQLKLKSPDLLHSLILSEAVRIEKREPKDIIISNFCKAWNFNNLRPDDWIRPDVPDCKSLVEKLITVYVKEIVDDNLCPTDDFILLIDEALSRFPDNQHLPEQRAKLFIREGQNENAISLYKGLLAHNRSKNYLWPKLAELISENDLKISLLCCALCQPSKEDFLGRIRIELANLFCQKGLFSEAAAELNIVRDYYNNSGWHLPHGYITAANQIPSDTIPTENNNYNTLSAKGMQFIYSDFPTSDMVIVRITKKIDNKRPKNKKLLTIYQVVDCDGKSMNIVAKRLGLTDNLKYGTIINVFFDDGRPLYATVKGTQNVEWLTEHVGIVFKKTNKNNQSFCFIDKSYVGAHLLKDVNDGDKVIIKSIKTDDRDFAISLQKSDS